MTDPNDLEPRQTTGDVVPDPGGYLALTMLIIVICVVGLFAIAMVISA